MEVCVCVCVSGQVRESADQIQVLVALRASDISHSFPLLPCISERSVS
jgi:hypothetical protein